MAKVEIEESDLLNVQHVANVTNQIMKNPAARAQFLLLAKQANPNLSIPEVDAAAPVLAHVKGISDRFDKFATDAAEREAARQKQFEEFLAAQAEEKRLAEEAKQVQQFQQTWTQQEDALRKQGWRQSGLDQVKAFAETHGIADLTIAADAFERRNPQPGPVESRPGWNLFSGPQEEDTFVPDQMKAHGNDDSRLDREIAATLAEIRAGY